MNEVFLILKNNYLLSRIICFTTYSKERSRVKGTVSDKTLPRNIYGYIGRYSDYLWYHDMLHRIVKYTFLVPFTSLISLLFTRWLTTRVDLTPETRNLYNFNQSYELALYDWCECFLLRDTWKRTGKRPCVKDVYVKYLDCYAVKILRTFKHLVLTFCRNDSAYLEFLNFLVFRLTVTMNRDSNSSIHHLIYTSQSINDVKYFIIQDKFNLLNVKRYATKTDKTKP